MAHSTFNSVVSSNENGLPFSSTAASASLSSWYSTNAYGAPSGVLVGGKSMLTISPNLENLYVNIGFLNVLIGNLDVLN